MNMAFSCTRSCLGKLGAGDITVTPCTHFSCCRGGVMELFISNNLKFSADHIGSTSSTVGNCRVKLRPNVTLGLGGDFDLVTGYNFINFESSCAMGRSNFNVDLHDRSLDFNFRCRFWWAGFRGLRQEFFVFWWG